MAIGGAYNYEDSCIVKADTKLLFFPNTNLISQYKVHINEPVSEMNNQFVKYYKASHQESDGLNFLALVFEKSYNISPLLLEKLSQYTGKYMTKILSYGITRVSVDDSERLVVIIKGYKLLNNLQNLLDEKGKLPFSYLSKNILPLLIEVISFHHAQGIACGNINPKNIIITDDNNVFLRETFITPTNYGQQQKYLAPEFSDCNEYGRATNKVEADIYALGITMLNCLTKDQAKDDEVSPDLYNGVRIEEGSYDFLNIVNYRISSNLGLFFRGTLNVSDLRWGVKELAEWFEGKKPSVPNNASKLASSMFFKDQNFYNTKALASAMFSSWNESLSFIIGSVFKKWVAKTEDENEQMNKLSKTLMEVPSRRLLSSNVGMDEYLFRVLAILASDKNIRTHAVCTNIKGLADTIFYNHYNNNRVATEAAMESMSNKWYKRHLVDNVVLDDVDLKIIEITDIYKSSGGVTTVGIERMVYQLNPHLPCQSQVFEKHYVINIDVFLRRLDELAKESPEKIIFDRHMLAFLATRVGVKSDKDAYLLKDFLGISQSPVALFLSLVIKANNLYPNIEVDYLTKVIAERLIELLEKNVYSNKLLDVLTESISSASDEGDIKQVHEIVTQEKLFHNDVAGYRKACKDIITINTVIQDLEKVDQAEKIGVLLGKKITVIFSYIMCALLTFMLVI